MSTTGWKSLLTGPDPFRRAGVFPIPAYSEFMPPPRLGRTPYGAEGPSPFVADDPWGWHVTEYEEHLELRPGLEAIARQVVGALVKLGRGDPAHGIARGQLADNPYWPPELADHPEALAHERFVTLLPLALSRTQDDKGRVRWTLFGASEQGPGRAFWNGFFTAPGHEAPAGEALAFFRRLLEAAYDEPPDRLGDLHGAGLRVHRGQGEPLPSWTVPYLWGRGQSLRAVRYLVTFCPFARLPAPVRRAYLAGALHLLPCPGSLLFWGISAYGRLREGLPLAAQIPLLHLVARHEGPHGVRVPQSGYLHEPGPGAPGPGDHHGPIRASYIRTHRTARRHRHDDPLVDAREDRLAHVLFAASADDMGLYGKPMARNVQVWTPDGHLLLDGPNASRAEIERAARAIRRGGLFGYRFQFPAMRVGRHEVYWHRPLVAYPSRTHGAPTLLPEAPLGYMTAYRADRIDPSSPVELWPRLMHRPGHEGAVLLFESGPDRHAHREALNVRKLLDARDGLGGRPLPRTFARRLLTLKPGETLESWLDTLPRRAGDREHGRALAGLVRDAIEPEDRPPPRRRGSRLPESLTFHRTGRRSFEMAYWRTIAALSAGVYLTKNNADVALDPATQAAVHRDGRDVDHLGDDLIVRHTKSIRDAGLAGRAMVGDVPFRWRTDFDFDWSGGWRLSREGPPPERDILVVIPGRDRRRAVIMADHYDTAFMEDIYEKGAGGHGPRIAARGADDNCSATATLLLAAPVLLELSRAGGLGCDVWLVHLTGEEFPADCLGARNLSQALVEGTLALRLPRRPAPAVDLSGVRVEGVFVLDMVAHNNDRSRDVFQIAPGDNRESRALALEAHRANEAWNASADVWNRRPSRRGRRRGRRSRDGARIPALARHPRLVGQVRPHDDPRSTLYNTDGQIFSDAGIPVVLFMEDYDIDRRGYHDSHDTMANIDLDYGSALAAIAIETVARVAERS